ncbi:MAG: hypothetical protein ABIU05_02840 [Nitrospirales bacterium]
MRPRVSGRIHLSMDVYVETRWTRVKRRGRGTGFLAVGLVVFALAGLFACERTSEQAAEPKKAVVADRPGVIHLTAEELARTVIEVTPVVRGQLLVPREFPATVQANENELAEVTTLVKGRVVKVHVDVG